MHSFTRKLLLYCLVFRVYFIFSRSPYGLDQLYNQQIQDFIYDRYFSIYTCIAIPVVGYFICRSIYRQFKSRSRKAILIYFKRFGFLKISITTLSLFYLSYFLIQILHCVTLYTNRIKTTAIATTTYHYGTDPYKDRLIQQYLYKENSKEYAKYYQPFKLTTKEGLLKLPYHITINTL